MWLLLSSALTVIDLASIIFVVLVSSEASITACVSLLPRLMATVPLIATVPVAAVTPAPIANILSLLVDNKFIATPLLTFSASILLPKIYAPVELSKAL